MSCISGCSISRTSGEMPKEVSDYFSKIEFGQLGMTEPEINYESISDNTVKASLTWNLEDTLRQDDWQVVGIGIFPIYD